MTLVSPDLRPIIIPVASPHAPNSNQGILRQRMSWDQFLALPNHPKAEWVDGEAIMMMAPASRTHNRVAKHLERLIESSLTGVEALRDVGLKLGNQARVPDLVVFPHDISDSDDNWLTTPPIIIVEVLSESTKNIDLFEKANEYYAAGISQYWIVDPQTKELTVHRNTSAGWQLLAQVDAAHPAAEITVDSYGIVRLVQEEIFARP